MNKSLIYRRKEGKLEVLAIVPHEYAHDLTETLCYYEHTNSTYGLFGYGYQAVPLFLSEGDEQRAAYNAFTA